MEEQFPGQSPRAMKQAIVLAAVLGVVALGVLSILRDRIVNPIRNQVSFTADAKVFAKPDIAQIELAVDTDRAKDAVTAVKNNTEKMNQVIAKLKELGVEEKDIKTTAYRLTPEYDYNNIVLPVDANAIMGLPADTSVMPPNRGAIITDKKVLAGYSVYQEVTVKIRDLNNVGKIIETVTNAGANQVGNPTFTIDDLTEIKKEARAEAVAKAKVQAQSMSELTGIKLGKLINVWENSNQAVPYYSYGLESTKVMGMGEGGYAPDIKVGENEVRVEITLTYEVK